MGKMRCGIEIMLNVRNGPIAEVSARLVDYVKSAIVMKFPPTLFVG